MFDLLVPDDQHLRDASFFHFEKQYMPVFVSCMEKRAK